MSCSIPPSLGSRFTTLLRSYVQGDGLPFATVLSEEQIERAAREEGVTFGRGSNVVYTQAITLWAFVGQVLAGHNCCVAAVQRVIAMLTAMGRTACSAATGAYCVARAKLPESFHRRLTYQVGSELESQAPAHWRWHNRRVLLADGTSSTLADTAENQREYPQPTTQRPGLGFPMIRMVALLGFATASVVGVAIGRYAGKRTGETALLRQLLDQLRVGDIVVADRYHCSYFMIVLLMQHGVDVVFRMHHMRDYDFRRGRRLGRNDHVVEWQRPQRPTWMDAATYETVPETLEVRELRFNVENPGYRTEEIVVATTLIDDTTYSKEEIADLYHQRWHAELDLRSIKQTLGMDELVCKTPAMVRKELWAYLLGYNMVRKVAAQSAWENKLQPRQLSFAGTLQILETFGILLLAMDEGMRRESYHRILVAIAANRVGDRPGRVEPRRRKRRNDQYHMLREPRAQARARLLNGGEE